MNKGNTIPENESTKTAKITYEQLEAYAAQTTEQAKKLFQENQVLRKAIYEHSLKEVEVALRCLDHADKFSPKFIEAVVERIEEIMNPQKESEEETTDNTKKD